MTAPTRRQLEALAAAADGLTGPQTAARLGVARTTANSHLSSAYQALGARGKQAAVAEARRLGLITPGPDGHTVTLPDRGPLTDLQWRYLVAIARGAKVPAVAREAGRCVQGVQAQLSAAYRAVGARNGTHAVAVCMARGWITPGDLGLPDTADQKGAA